MISKLAVAVAISLALPQAAAAVVAETGQSVVSEANGELAEIRYHLFWPDSASAENPVPMVMQTHGWGGTGATNIDDDNRFIKAGYGVMTWDQRGFGASGGKVHINAPEYEGQDAQRLIDVLAADPRAAKDGPGDPRIGMAGGSYAGGIQFVTAALDKRVDAIAPEIAWNNLYNSLAPDGVIKIQWGSLLYGFGARSAYSQQDGYDMAIHRAFAQGLTTGAWTHETQKFFESKGPWHLLEEIDAPTFIIQGTTDTAFPPSQAIDNWEQLSEEGGLPLKMAWYCGGHGVCSFSGGPSGYVARRVVNWFDRYVKSDETVNTGASFEYLDQSGVWHEASDFPVPGARSVKSEATSGVVTVPGEPTAGGVVGAAATHGLTSLELALPSFSGTLVGEPVVTMRARVLGSGTSDRPLEAPLFFQLVDKGTGRVLGNQTIPKVFGLDHEPKTYRFPIEAVAYSVTSTDQLVLEVNSASSNYLLHRGAAVFDIEQLSVELPVVDD